MIISLKLFKVISKIVYFLQKMLERQIKVYLKFTDILSLILLKA